MGKSNEEIPVRILPLQPDMTASFKDLLRIYREAIPQGERKSDDTLAEMLQRTCYEFQIACSGDAVAGFSIVRGFAEVDACLLEYMAVDRPLRGRGIGGELFRAACRSAIAATRYVLIEVDSDAELVADQEIRRRRKAFYRALGCREVAGLCYLMPLVTEQSPPEMNLLVFRPALPRTISKSRLRQWLECIYTWVYQESGSDPRIDLMLKALPNDIKLR